MIDWRSAVFFGFFFFVGWARSMQSGNRKLGISTHCFIFYFY